MYCACAKQPQRRLVDIDFMPRGKKIGVGNDDCGGLQKFRNVYRQHMYCTGVY
jgi:hypothetical protein